MSEPLIVVPIDGSEISERAVPYASALAGATGARLLVLTVWEEGDRALISDVPEVAESLFKRGEEHYEHYLAGLAKKAAATGVDVETQVRVGDPTEEILRVIDKRDPRLLVIASHGRSGLSRWRYGSVANKLAREAPVPTLIVGPKALEDGARGTAVRRILVPLDGSPLAESALRPALDLADALDADLILAQVLRWASQAFIYGVPDVDVALIDRELTKAAEEYLQRVRGGLQTNRAIETKVLHGLPADALIELIEAEHVDLVVMASHTRRGLARAVLGSVADWLLQGKAPVLLIRPEEVAAATRATTGRYCHACGRASPFVQVLPDDVCRRCGQHLRGCANCVYFDGIACLIKRPEVHDTYPGRQCPMFQFRETAGPPPRPHASDATSPAHD